MKSAAVPDDELQAVLDEVIAPLVEIDGGSIRWESRTGDTVKVSLAAACVGCPGQSQTLQKIVLPLLRRLDESVQVVVAVPRGSVLR